MTNNLKLYVGIQDDFSNEKLVRMVNILKSRLVSLDLEIPDVNIGNVSNVVSVPTENCKRKRVKCFRCGLVGHIRRNCRVKLINRKAPEPTRKVPDRFSKRTFFEDLR